MTRLLVSVRDAAEAQTALEAGAHLIDVKEPLRGSLGAADEQSIIEVLRVIAGRVPVSAALGELFEERAVRLPLSADSAIPLSYVKWGLAGGAQHPDWRAVWERRVQALPPHIIPVAVQYADWEPAQGPPPRELLRACRANKIQVLLIDTFDKSGGGLLELWPLDPLQTFVDAARDAGMQIVLAGSLTPVSIARLLPLMPDYFAVRGAVCHESRTGSIDARRVRSLVELLGTGSPT